MNKQNVFCALIVLSLFLSAAVGSAADISTNTARMQAMDKITGRVSEIDVPVNGLANFGTFSVLVRKCVTKSAEETPENTAFVDVVDNYQTNEPVNIFKGWMFSSTPAINAVEHPIYDIWLLKCYNRPQKQTNLLSAEQLALRDTIQMRRNKSHLQNERIDMSETGDSATSEAITAEQIVEPEVEIIRLEVTDKQPAVEDEAAEEDDDDFVSEGEEDIVITEAEEQASTQSETSPQPLPSAENLETPETPTEE